MVKNFGKLQTDLFEYTTPRSLPRGIRNNNPLNLIYVPRNHWKNQTGSDGTFCTFTNFCYGIRAAWKNIKTILKRHPDMNIGEFIYTWCPDSTAKSYTKFVIKALGYATEDDCSLLAIIKRTNLSDVLRNSPVVLLRAMIVVENGYCPYTDNEILYSIHIK